MRDACGRTVNYLRLSLTARCNLRCVYCWPATLNPADRPPAGRTLSKPPVALPLRADEIVALVEHLAVQHGLRKVRLTGGEPTCRPDFEPILRRLTRIPDLREVTMTTNGLTLSRQAQALASAGLRRLNISLDALRPDVFARMTGAAALPRVLAGIAAARRAGLDPIKLNTVVMRGVNDTELPGLVRFAAAMDLEIRFIELMPMGPLAGQWSQHFLPESGMRAILDAVVAEWEPLPTDGAAQRSGSARRYRAWLRGGGTGRVGFITPMSCDFCDACNRIRITADGRVHPCLMGPATGALLPALRPHFDPARLSTILAQALAGKAAVHAPVGTTIMTQLGG